jgi:N-formylglutamate deformylase
MHIATSPSLWEGQEAASPVIAVAVHAGHALREEVAAVVALDDAARLREEDPYTGEWTALAPTRLVAGRSRFEVDLNRPRDSAVYTDPEHTWGLDVWGGPLDPAVAARSLAGHDAFYGVLAGMCDRAQEAFGRFVVYDLHTYNHRRSGPVGTCADPALHPDVNVGTGSMDRELWGPLVDRFMADLSAAAVPYGQGRLDVRENVCFRGRELARFVHERYPGTGCALAIEVKKFFMDEHTGERDSRLFAAVGDALAATVPGVREELERLEKAAPAANGAR